ncbi:MAG: hypothetical protein IKB20_06135 [Clostridia bacterium]|nr:hypothetical protein [Clostridia bacterium]
MATVKKKIKWFFKYLWTLFKASVPAGMMYCCAGLVLMMLSMRGTTLEWNAKSITWTVVCNLVVMGYNFLMAWASGTVHYEMLVSGNVKRMSMDEYGGGLKISSHKEMEEYRIWKGFAIGGFMAFMPLLFGILLGANQSNINADNASSAIAWLILLSFLFSGWASIPFYLMNACGMSVSYFWVCTFALLPIAITGGGYIAGAYAKRNKNLREQLIAQRAAEAETNKPKKINYGGLPGTKPKKKK